MVAYRKVGSVYKSHFVYIQICLSFCMCSLSFKGLNVRKTYVGSGTRGAEVARFAGKQEVRVSIPGAAKEFGSFFLSTSTSVHQTVYIDTCE